MPSIKTTSWRLVMFYLFVRILWRRRQGEVVGHAGGGTNRRSWIKHGRGNSFLIKYWIGFHWTVLFYFPAPKPHNAAYISTNSAAIIYHSQVILIWIWIWECKLAVSRFFLPCFTLFNNPWNPSIGQVNRCSSVHATSHPHPHRDPLTDPSVWKFSFQISTIQKYQKQKPTTLHSIVWPAGAAELD